MQRVCKITKYIVNGTNWRVYSISQYKYIYMHIYNTHIKAAQWRQENIPLSLNKNLLTCIIQVFIYDLKCVCMRGVHFRLLDVVVSYSLLILLVAIFNVIFIFIFFSFFFCCFAMREYTTII